MLDEQAIPVENRIKISRLSAGTLCGAHPWHSEELERTGAKVVAVERGQEVIIEFDDDFRLQAGDALFVCGTITCLERYQQVFQAAAALAQR